MQRAWRPVSRKYSAIVTPVYGAMNWSGADSLAPGRQDEIDAGVGLREGLAARGKPRGFGMAFLGDRPLDPLARHELDERLRRREVVARLCWGDGLLEILFGRHGSTKIR